MNVLLIYRSGIAYNEFNETYDKYKGNKVYAIVENEIIKNCMKYLYKDITFYFLSDLLKDKINMKFDYIVGNPPYQKQVGPDKTQTIWDLLVVKFYSLLKDGGEMDLIHPGGWRFSTKNSNNAQYKVKNIYKSNKIIRMEFNDKEQGLRKFGASTDYDIVHLKKERSLDYKDTIVKTKHGIVEINLKKYEIIPTNRFDILDKLNANKNEEKVNLIFNSNYHTSSGKNCRTRKNKNNEFKYPVVYGYPQKGLKLFYSNTNCKGHFGISKLIIIKASPFSVLDLDSKYGMTQFAAAILDSPINLYKMQKVIESKEFKILKKYFCGIGGDAKNPIIDAPGTMFKFIREFKKDFWKEFYTEEMEQELINEGILDINGNLTSF